MCAYRTYTNTFIYTHTFTQNTLSLRFFFFLLALEDIHVAKTEQPAYEIPFTTRANKTLLHMYI